MKSYKQTTYETCLACSLQNLCGIKPSRLKELEIWKHGWDFNFMLGQANFVSKKYKQKLNVIVESKGYYKHLKDLCSRNITLKSKVCSLKLIDSLLKDGPVVVYVDHYYFRQAVHAPHFITILSKNGDYTFADSWDGKIKKVAPLKLEESINGLRKHLLYSPVLISKL